MSPPLCALSVDLDEIHHYRRLHGRTVPVARPGPVHERAVARLAEWAASVGAPITWFAVGEDLGHSAAGERLRALVGQGHAVENHTHSHRYDFGSLRGAALRDEVARAHDVIAERTGRAPVGFRAPGYARSPALLDLLCELGYEFDSSLLPSPAYYAVKALVMARLRVAGRVSAAVLGNPLETLRRRGPHPARRCGPPPYRSLLELPIQVLPAVRLPVIGTSLLLAGAASARWLVRGCAGSPLLNLELHGVDALGPEDGIEDLRDAQPDLAMRLSTKEQTIRSVLEDLRDRGYRFVTLADAARNLAR